MTTSRDIVIMLGYSCNMQCRHCVQGVLKVTSPEKCMQMVDPKTNVFPLELSDKVFNHIKDLYDHKCLGSISFWGGEPLLYWEYIKKAILKLETIGDIRFGFTTNGKLIDIEKIEFIKKHNIRMVLSYDAIEPLYIRNEVPTEEQLKLFLSLPKKDKYVCGVLNAKHPNYKENYLWLQNKFPNTFVYVRLMRVTNNMNPEFYDFKEDDVKKSVHDFVDYMLNTDIDFLSPKAIREFVSDVRLSYENVHNIDNKPIACAIGTSTESIDMNGNMYYCFNSTYKVSTCDNVDQGYNNVLQFAYRNRLKNCDTCPIKYMCGKVCSLAIKTEDRAEYLECKYRRMFRLAFFDEFLKNPGKLAARADELFIIYKKRLGL